MQIAIALILITVGVTLLLWIFRSLRRMQARLGTYVEPPAAPAPPSDPDGPVSAEELVYLFAHDLVKPVPRRPMGSIPRDRAHACQTGDELDPDDFARQLLYVVLVELIEQECVQWRFGKRDPTFLPPYPHKQWELQLRQAKSFPSSPLSESFGVGFQLARSTRERASKNAQGLSPEDDYFTLEELLERALKAIREERTFWERGTCCSDLRGHVETALIAAGYLEAPSRDTWLETVRRGKSSPRIQAIERLSHDAVALSRKLDVFRKRFGAPADMLAAEDEQGKPVDVDQKLANFGGDPSELPLDDALRVTIHEAVTAIRQLEPSGEAGI